jgi:hypothetical protein
LIVVSVRPDPTHRGAGCPAGAENVIRAAQAGVLVLVDDAAEAVVTPDVEPGELAGICDRIRERV